MVTGEQVCEAVEKADITRIDHHDCSLCGRMVYYFVEDAQLYFNSGCGCSWSPPQPRTWDDAANWINMQSNKDVRARLMRAFGIEPAEPHR